MSKDWYQDIVDFLTRVRHDTIPQYPQMPDSRKLVLAKKLINEEVNEELLPALDKGDLVAIADGGVDAIVVILDAMVFCGIDIRPIWDVIHKSNMAKEGGAVREDGKLLKPEGWQAPDVRSEIMAQMSRESTGAS